MCLWEGGGGWGKKNGRGGAGVYGHRSGLGVGELSHKPINNTAPINNLYIGYI